MILVGNKCDLSQLRVISSERGNELAEQYNIPYIEVSAVSGRNVREAINILLESVMSR